MKGYEGWDWQSLVNKRERVRGEETERKKEGKKSSFLPSLHVKTLKNPGIILSSDTEGLKPIYLTQRQEINV